VDAAVPLPRQPRSASSDGLKELEEILASRSARSSEGTGPFAVPASANSSG
jgi:hypothetical protein